MRTQRAHSDNRSGVEVLSAPRPVEVAGGWPAAFLRPQGMACHAALGPLVLVAGRHSVRVLHAGGALGAHAAPVQLALDACLASWPSLKARGLGDLSVECAAPPGAAEGRCAALLLAADGERALRCPLSGNASLREAPSWMELPGGPWRALASAGPGAVWALRAGRAGAPPEEAFVALLQPGPGSAGTLRPTQDLPLDPGAQGVARLSALGETALLGLSRAGHVVAWDLLSGASRALRLPGSDRQGGAGEWTALCTWRESLLLAGDGAVGDSASPGLWEVPLPPAVISILA